jgi:hypothetical protein
MPWVRRGRYRYYVHRRKVRGAFVRQPFGRGPEAQLAAALAAQRQREREAEWDRRRQERGRWEADTRTLQQLIAVSDLLVRAALLAAGFHEHQQGDWRRRRHGNSA